jgi:hypothetical protein
MLFNSFNSLSEKRRSWSAEVPLKNPETGGCEHNLVDSVKENLPASAMTSKQHLDQCWERWRTVGQSLMRFPHLASISHVPLLSSAPLLLDPGTRPTSCTARNLLRKLKYNQQHKSMISESDSTMKRDLSKISTSGDKDFDAFQVCTAHSSDHVQTHRDTAECELSEALQFNVEEIHVRMWRGRRGP